MKKIYLVLLVCCLGASFLLAASPAVGSWDCQGQGDRDFSFTLTFAEDNGELVGTMVSQRGERALSDVKCEEGVITAKTNNPNFSMNIRAEIDGDSLKGTMS
ncbi:MAG: hypothetical protein ABIJ42_08125, partial [Acidobacteriota bacterium]